uniref:ubiquitinyl hydrolase 1 n=1 Tax=Xenopsylla cheopis TaxID=163159 RepID=A0A6M2DDN6_XENCH
MMSTSQKEHIFPDKWVCEYCTFENYASSLKCTMCRGSKPLLNEDIFRLSPVTESSSHMPGLAIGSSESAYPDKWSCSVCTFLNWPRTQSCVQCNTKKSTNYENYESPRISQNSDLAQAMITNQPTKRNSSINLRSRTTSPINYEDSQMKWSCPVCTYENWPKNLKCTMCGTQRSSLNHTSVNKDPNLRILSPNKNPNCTITSQAHSRNNSNGSIISTGLPSPERDQAAALNNSINKFSGSNTTLSSDDCSGNNMIIKRHNSRLGCNEGGTQNIAQNTNNCELERRIRQIRRQADWSWLNACLGVLEGDINPVEAYISSGGDPARQLTANEVALLNRSSAFDVGHTLIHLAIRFHREDMLATLLSQISGSGSGIKRVPSYVAPDLATDIRRHMANTVRLRKGSFPCSFITEHATFALPADIEELPASVQEQLFEELLDKDSQQQLESAPPALNWSLEVTVRLGSRLYALWNRSAGDCLLDSAMQATWGVFDRDNTLRRALADSLHQAGHVFFPRWKEYEKSQASLMHFSLDDSQWEDDWAGLLSLASQPGSALEQLHVFALAHVLRRPIIVYGVKYVKSFRGEALGYARFEGVYLPLLWDQSFCIRSPIALGYTRGHFTALVTMEPYSRLEDRDADQEITFLPLMDHERKLLPVHFLTQAETGREESILRQWLDVCVTEGGLLVGQQRLHKRPLLVAQMLEEWLNHYRRLVQINTAPFTSAPLLQGYSSDGDTDEE